MSDTKTAILDLAEQLIRSRGYHAFSYKDIARPLKIKNAAIHYYYPAKEALGMAVIERTRLQFLRDTASWSGLSPKEQLAHFVQIYRRSQQRKLVCFMGALSGDYDALPQGMQTELKKAKSEIGEWVTQLLEQGRVQGAFHFKGEARARALLLVAAMLAALMLQKVSEEDVFSPIEQALLADL